MGLFHGKKVKGLKFSTTKRSTYLLKRKPCVLSPGASPFTKRTKQTSLTPLSLKGRKTTREESPMKLSKKKKLFSNDRNEINTSDENVHFRMPPEILHDLGCVEISLKENDTIDTDDDDDDINDDDEDDLVQDMGEEHNANDIEVLKQQLSSTDYALKSDNVEYQSFSNHSSNELQNLLPSVIKEFEVNGKLNVLENFFRLVKDKKFPMRNMAFLLWCDVVRWFENSDTRQMRYSPECLQFFWVGKKLFGGRFVRFMSGMKNETELLKGGRSFDPHDARVNFACPSENVLSTVNPLGDELPVNYKPGLMEPMIKFKAQNDGKNNSYVLMLDGKKIKHGTDIDLLGFETGKTLRERKDEKEMRLGVLNESINAVTHIQDHTNEIQETQEENKRYILVHLTELLMLFSNVLKELRALKFKKQLSLTKLKELGGAEWRKSKYAYAIDTCMTTLWRIDNVIDKALSVQRCICKTGSHINKVAHLFAETDIIDLNSQGNLKILKPPEKLPKGTDMSNTQIIKQRSDLWFNERKKYKVTGSTIYQAIGCDTLKRQKEHFEKVFKGVSQPEPSESQQKAMQHGTDCEIHQIATMCGMIMPFLYPDLIFQEEGFYVKDKILASPDGSLRSKNNAAKFAFEGKAPMEKTFTTTLHDKVPDRYIPQVLFEQRVLNSDGTLYMSWTDSSCTLFMVNPDETLSDEIQEEINDVYFTDKPRQMTRLSKRAKEIKNNLSKLTERCIFLGEFPVVKGQIKENCTEKELENISPYLKPTEPKGRTIPSFTYNELQRHLLLGQEIIKDAYEVQRIMASQVVVYLLADLDRFWKDEQPHAIPVLYFYRGYSLSMDVTRKITETCKAACRSNGLDVIVTAADGEFTTLIVRDRAGNPLTQHQLLKDVWKETGKMTKSEIIQEFLKETKEVLITEGKSTDTSQKEHRFRIVSSKNGAVSKIKTPEKGWSQPKEIKLSARDTNENNAVEVEEISGPLDNDAQEETQEEDQSPDNKDIDDVSLSEIDTSNNNSSRFGQLIDLSNVSKVLSTLNNKKWSNISEEALGEYFKSANSMKQLTVKELIEVTKCINRKEIPANKPLKTSNLKNHELVNQLSELIADGSKIPERVAKVKRSIPSLKKMTQSILMKRSYPKKVLNVSYSNFVWPDKLQQWKLHARVSDAVRIYGIDTDFFPYYVPDTSELGDFEISVYDKTHLGSNLRKAICLDRIEGVSKKAWQRVSEVRPDVLNPTLIDVTEDGKIIDQMKEKLARNMLSKAVEEQMIENGDTDEAKFCEIFREGLYSADDKPGIPAVERCKKRLALIEWLNDGVMFGSFPPYGATIKGLSHILYEGLRSSSEAKLYLYAIAKTGSYCVRAPNTLCSESFFSTMQEMDPWGQGILTSDGVEKHISDFTTITALKMKDDRSFHLKTKRDAAYPVQTLSNFSEELSESTLPPCHCRERRYISCIVPKDHFFDTPARARLQRSEKPFRFSDINEPHRGEQPIRSQYGYKINETKVLPSKRLGLNFDK